jgi:hypothetical protein
MVQLNPLPGSRGREEQPPDAGQKTGCIRFASDPSGADVYLGNRLVGMTPLVIDDLEPGLHETSMILPFYRVYTENVYLEPGDVMDVQNRFTLGDINVPGMDVILSLFSGITLPGLPGGEEVQTPAGSDDRQKAYEELVRSLEEDGSG